MNRLLEIETIQLRIPGLSRPEARRVGVDIVERVSKEIPAHGPKQRLGKVQMQISVPVGASSDQIAKLVAQAILEKLA